MLASRARWVGYQRPFILTRRLRTGPAPQDRAQAPIDEARYVRDTRARAAGLCL